MSDDSLKAVPKKPIEIAMGILRDNGYKPTGESIMGISEWALPGSDTTLGITQKGAQVGVIMNFASKRSDLLKGYTVRPSFTVENLNDLIDFARTFADVARKRGLIPEAAEPIAKKQVL